MVLALNNLQRLICHKNLTTYQHLFQVIKLSINKRCSSIRPIDRTLSGANTRGQSGTWSDGNEGVVSFP